MRSAEFLQSIQVFAARGSVGASTVRGQGPGVAEAARKHLATIDLSMFSVSDGNLFNERLEVATSKLAMSLPKGSRSWGLSRKVTNIFLRNALYTTYLAEHYGLKKAEGLFELPLDSVCVSYLVEGTKRGSLPRWSGVKHLTPNESYEFQQRALFLAQQWRTERVHLDAHWWGGRPDIQ